MGLNIGYLKSDRTVKGDECYTPFYAVDPIVKYVKPGQTVWLPFDEEWSAFNVALTEAGFKTICSHIANGQDFFEYEPDEYDVIISNPPFSLKDDVLERAYALDKPFALLMPIQTLQGKRRFKYMSQGGLQLLTFNARIGFHTPEKMDKHIKSSSFASAYFCRNFLPADLILEELTEYDRALL